MNDPLQAGGSLKIHNKFFKSIQWFRMILPYFKTTVVAQTMEHFSFLSIIGAVTAKKPDFKNVENYNEVNTK